MHKRLDELRVQYGDNEQISQQYIDGFMPLAKQGKVFGVDKNILDGIIKNWEKSKNKKN